MGTTFNQKTVLDTCHDGPHSSARRQDQVLRLGSHILNCLMLSAMHFESGQRVGHTSFYACERKRTNKRLPGRGSVNSRIGGTEPRLVRWLKRSCGDPEGISVALKEDVSARETKRGPGVGAEKDGTHTGLRRRECAAELVPAKFGPISAISAIS